MARRGTLRARVITRWGTVCWLCHKPIDLNVEHPHPDSFTIDHVLPRAHGGGDDVRNLRPAHRRCNNARGHSHRPVGRSGLRIF